MLDDIFNLFPNFKGATAEVWEWMSDLISHLIIDVITYWYSG